MKKIKAILLLAAALALCAAGAQAIDFQLEDESDEVARIQEALLELDFYYGEITGHFGTRTQRGVSMFQDDVGLPVTGVADDETRAQLYQAAGMEMPPISQTVLETNTVLRRGDSGMAVTWLQESLKELGYYKGEITGSYGLLTHEAVRLFQRGSGLSSDGVAGRNTVRKIVECIEEKNNPVFTPEPDTQGDILLPETGDQENITTLKLGVQNSAVRKLQEDLSMLGFYTGTVTGNFGRLTKEAVRLFQRAHDLPSDGVAGPLTLAEIAEEMEDMLAPTATAAPTAAPNNAWGGLVEYLTPAPTAKPNNAWDGYVQVLTPAPTAVPTAKPMITSQVGFLSIERTLEMNQTSQDVVQLQAALKELGYYSASITGYFDLQTQGAVMAYQAAKGLTVTGVANRVTLIRINDDIFRRMAGQGND